MLFWQFLNMTTFVRVVGNMQDQHFNDWLFSNPVDKVLILVESRGQICLKVFLFLDLVPWIGEYWCIKMLVWHFAKTLIYVVMLENCLSNIWMHGCAPIQRTKLKLMLKFDEARISDCNLRIPQSRHFFKYYSCMIFLFSLIFSSRCILHTFSPAVESFIYIIKNNMGRGHINI